MSRRRLSLRAAGTPRDEAQRSRHPGGRLRVAPMLAALAIASGCGSFFGSPEPSGLGSDGIKNGCTWATVHEDCLLNEYCDAPDCTHTGTCVARPPPQKSGELNWACGCDGVTYWNGTFARAQGVTAPTLGQCTGSGSAGGVNPADPLACSDSKKCPAGAVCLPLATSNCNGTVTQGYCWAWPDDFACTAGAQIGYLSCGTSTKCMTECEAITARARYRMSTINCR